MTAIANEPVGSSSTPPNTPASTARDRWPILDLAALLMIVATILGLVIVGNADSTVIAAAGTFVVAVFGLWLKIRT